MNKVRVKTIYKKELLEIKQDKTLVASLLTLPVILGIIFPMIFIALGYNKSFLLGTDKVSFMTKQFVDIIPARISGNTRTLYIIFMYLF